jgi:hypothetical protein
MTTTKKFREWFDEYCKTENVNKPTQLFVCLEFSIMWEVDMDNIDKAKDEALAECIKFNYATTEQFETVFDKFINDSRVLAHLMTQSIFKDRK